VAPPGQAQPPYAAPEPYADEGPWRRSHGSAGVDYDRARQLVMGPALALIVTGGLGIAVNLLKVFLWFAMPDQMQRNSAKLVELLGGADGAAAVAGPGFGRFLCMVFIALSLIILMAGVRMLSLHSYGLAVAGSILAMMNISECCCLLGLPVGIWALVMLMLPDVRDAFQ
jgi:hypothetical protein